jgi:hypothetical protein
MGGPVAADAAGPPVGGPPAAGSAAAVAEQEASVLVGSYSPDDLAVSRVGNAHNLQVTRRGLEIW